MSHTGFIFIYLCHFFSLHVYWQEDDCNLYYRSSETSGEKESFSMLQEAEKTISRQLEACNAPSSKKRRDVRGSLTKQL